MPGIIKHCPYSTFKVGKSGVGLYVKMTIVKYGQGKRQEHRIDPVAPRLYHEAMSDAKSLEGLDRAAVRSVFPGPLPRRIKSRKMETPYENLCVQACSRVRVKWDREPWEGYQS